MSTSQAQAKAQAQAAQAKKEEEEQSQQQQAAGELELLRIRDQLLLERQREQQAQALQIAAKSDEEQLKLHRMLLFQRELQLLNQQQNLRNNRPCVTGDRVVIVGSSATGGRYDGREGLVVSDGSSAKSAGGPSFPPD